MISNEKYFSKSEFKRLEKENEERKGEILAHYYTRGNKFEFFVVSRNKNVELMKLSGEKIENSLGDYEIINYI